MRLTTVLSPALLLAAAACSGISVDTTHDHEFDFAAARTFEWMEVPAGAETAVDDTSLVGMLKQELEARGLRQSAQSPDLRVAVHRSIKGSLNVDKWGYTMEGGRLHYYDLQQGTLVVDMVDPQSHRNVWRGTAEGAFRMDMLPAEREAFLRDVLGRMFADFPPR